MNPEVNVKIKEDFYILKKLISSNEHIARILKIDFAVAKEIISSLASSSENGPIEVKNYFLRNIFDILDDALYKAITPGKLNEVLKKSNELVFLALINFKVLNAKKKPKPKPIKNKEIDYEKFEIKEIMQEIPELSKKYPESTRYIRLITNLLKKYKEVSMDMEEKLLVAREQSKTIIKETFEKELNDIINSVKKHYYNIIQNIPALRAQYQGLETNDLEEINTDDFDLYNFTNLNHFLLKELSEFSRIRSCLVYIKKEGYNTLPIIMELYQQQKFYYRLLNEEERSIFNFMSDNGISIEEYNFIVSRIGAEISNYIQNFYIQPYTHVE